MIKVLKYSALIFIILLSATQMSFAIPYTWVDSVANNTSPLNNGNPDYVFTYNITSSRTADNVLTDPSNPFNPGPGLDVISTADLLLDFSANGGPLKTALITLDLDTLTATTFSFTSDDHTDITLAATALLQLNSDGTLDMKVHRNGGTFTLTDSTLTATGTDNTPTINPPSPKSDPVPEPSTFFLLGAGLAGVGLVRKGIKK